jgi:hypothetical protein
MNYGNHPRRHRSALAWCALIVGAVSTLLALGLFSLRGLRAASVSALAAAALGAVAVDLFVVRRGWSRLETGSDDRRQREAVLVLLVLVIMMAVHVSHVLTASGPESVRRWIVTGASEGLEIRSTLAICVGGGTFAAWLLLRASAQQRWKNSPTQRQSGIPDPDAGMAEGEALHEVAEVVDLASPSWVPWRAEPLRDAPGALIRLKDKPVVELRQQRQSGLSPKRRLFTRSFLVRCGSEVFECNAREGLSCEIDIRWATKGRRARMVKPLFGRGQLYLDGELTGTWEIAKLTKRVRRFRHQRRKLTLIFEPNRQVSGSGRVRVAASSGVETGEESLLVACAFLLGLVRRW